MRLPSPRPTAGRRLVAVVAAGLAAGLAAGPVGPAAGAAPAVISVAPSAAGSAAPPARWDCPPDGRAVGFSDALDKLVVGGVTLGGLSDLARDRRRGVWTATVDNDDTQPARLWSFRRLAHPVVVGSPLVLRRADGTPYTGEDSDFEGLAVLRSGRYVVSSETEPSIRVFGRTGRQVGRLRVPARFAVAPAGQATDNAGLEGLTLTPDRRRLVAAMEGTLDGDVSAGGVDLYRRLLVYAARGGDRFRLDRQVGYRVDTGMRIAEVASPARGRLLVLEAAYDPAVGNTVRLYAVSGLDRARDVSGVRDLSRRPHAVVRKRLVADVTACPSLGAPTQGMQTNPLLDNYEGMAVSAGRGPRHRVALLSDDNFSDSQTTRLLRLRVRLPAGR